MSKRTKPVKRRTRTEILKDSLSYLKFDEQIRLEEDSFLTGDLDGGEKIRGFTNDSVDHNDSNREFSVLTPDDLEYIFKGSARIYKKSIIDKIKDKEYEITKIK